MCGILHAKSKVWYNKSQKSWQVINSATDPYIIAFGIMSLNGLKDKKWTHIENKWLGKLMKHLKKAQSSNIKQIRLIRHIGRLDIYDNSREYEIEDDCHMYEIFLENDTTHYVNFGQINDIIGEEEWHQGEVNYLCNIASSQNLFLGEQRRRNPLILMLYASV